MEICVTYRHATAFPQKECLSQKEATGMESPKMYCSSPWKNPTYLCGSANYPVSLGAVEGRELKYAILRAYLSAWYSISRKGMFISKGSYGYGECKNDCSGLSKTPTYLCGSANYLVSLGAVEGRELKYAILRAYLSAWYSVSRKGMFISKGSYGHGECKNVLLRSVEKLQLPV